MLRHHPRNDELCLFKVRYSLMKHARTPWKKPGSAWRHGGGPTAIIREIHDLPVLRSTRLTHQ
jgi:hypothetical protein